MAFDGPYNQSEVDMERLWSVAMFLGLVGAVAGFLPYCLVTNELILKVILK